MQLKLVKFRNKSMKSLVVLNPAGGSVIWSKIGEVSKPLASDFAHKLLSECGDMLELVKDYETKVITAPKNKVGRPRKVPQTQGTLEDGVDQLSSGEVAPEYSDL